MYCNNCGNQIDDNAVVCIHCGAPTQNAQFNQPAQQQPAQANNTIATVGFVLAFFIPLAGLICSIIGLKRVNQFNGNGKGLAVAGIIISAILMVIEIIVIAVYASVIIAVLAGASSAAA